MMELREEPCREAPLNASDARRLCANEVLLQDLSARKNHRLGSNSSEEHHDGHSRGENRATQVCS